jgi:hypothetical protein
MKNRIFVIACPSVLAVYATAQADPSFITEENSI